MLCSAMTYPRRIRASKGVEMVTRAIAAAVTAVLLSTPAAAEKLPSWAIADICREDSAPGQCSMFESRARNAVTGGWGFLLPEVQSYCLEATSSPLDNSWRALAACIEQRVLRSKAEHAIATSSTPSKPEPAAQPAVSETAPASESEAQPAAAEPESPAPQPGASDASTQPATAEPGAQPTAVETAPGPAKTQ